MQLHLIKLNKIIKTLIFVTLIFFHLVST